MKRTNVLLLIIAVLLFINIVIKLFESSIVNADSGIQKVWIVKVGSNNVYDCIKVKRIDD